MSQQLTTLADVEILARRIGVPDGHFIDGGFDLPAKAAGLRGYRESLFSHAPLRRP